MQLETNAHSDVVGEDGNFVQAYTVNIEKPIYMKDDLTDRENVEYLKNENYNVWKKVYEDFYKTKLEYTTNNQRLEAINGK